MNQAANTSTMVSLHVHRDETVARLYDAYTKGRLTLDELNDRVALIRDDSTIGELDALLLDVPMDAALHDPDLTSVASASSGTPWYRRLWGWFRSRGK